jgi:hypothetical protein
MTYTESSDRARREHETVCWIRRDPQLAELDRTLDALYSFGE